MKIRSDFVTNSSSSSFICEVCGCAEGGYELSLSDAGMCECENGHTFCKDHQVDNPDKYKEDAIIRYLDQEIKAWSKHFQVTKRRSHQEQVDKLSKWYEKITTKVEGYEDVIEEVCEDEYDFDYSIPKECCPICTMATIRGEDMIKYICGKLGVTEEQIRTEIKSKYKTFEDFIKIYNRLKETL